MDRRDKQTPDRLRQAALAAGILLLGSPAFGAVINSGASGLTDPVSVVTFSERSFPDTSPISTEFSGLGVTFSPNLYYRQTSAWEAQGINGPNIRSGDPIVSTFSILFDDAITAVAFASIASPVTQATITARLGGVDVESFTTEINLENNSWYGFTDTALDEVQISYSAVTRLRVDNIQRGEVVPEPGTSLLALLGLLGILGFPRRRQ